MLTFEHVTFQYAEDPAPIISDLSFHVTPESFVSIIGASGWKDDDFPPDQ